LNRKKKTRNVNGKDQTQKTETFGGVVKASRKSGFGPDLCKRKGLETKKK